MIADDEPIVREALTSLMADDPEISVVGTGGDAEEAIAIARRETRRRPVGCPDAQRRGTEGRAGIGRVSPAPGSSHFRPTTVGRKSARCSGPAPVPIS